MCRGVVLQVAVVSRHYTIGAHASELLQCTLSNCPTDGRLSTAAKLVNQQQSPVRGVSGEKLDIRQVTRVGG